MNILFLIPRLNIGGAETHVADLAPLVKKAGHNVHLASGGGILAQKLKAQGLPHHFLPIRLSSDFCAFLLQFIVKKYHIDIVHAHSAAAGLTALKCKERYTPSLKVIYTAHGLFGRKKELPLLRCNKIVAVSQCVRDVALENGCEAQKVCVIYNGIDINRFCPHENLRESLRTAFDIPPAAFCLALVARIKNLRNKGHQVILNILAQKKCAKDWHLLVIGSGKGSRALKQQIKKLDLKKRVHFIGHRTDVADCLAAADVVTLPSRFETFGLSLAEGMATQKPGVAFAVGGIGEMLKDGKNGFLIPYGDEKTFSQKLNLLAEDENLRYNLGLAARQSIAENFSMDKMLAALLHLYEKIKRA